MQYSIEDVLESQPCDGALGSKKSCDELARFTFTGPCKYKGRSMCLRCALLTMHQHTHSMDDELEDFRNDLAEVVEKVKRIEGIVVFPTGKWENITEPIEKLYYKMRERDGKTTSARIHADTYNLLVDYLKRNYPEELQRRGDVFKCVVALFEQYKKDLAEAMEDFDKIRLVLDSCGED